MRGEHCVEQRLFPALAEFGKACLFRVQRFDLGEVFGSGGRRDKALEPCGAALERLAFQFGDEAVHVRQ